MDNADLLKQAALLAERFVYGAVEQLARWSIIQDEEPVEDEFASFHVAPRSGYDNDGRSGALVSVLSP